MQLLDWLEKVLALQTNPGELLEAAVESAIEVLRSRAQQARAGLAHRSDPRYGKGLWEMTEHLLDITEDLEDFLDSGDFRSVRAARLRALCMGALEDKLYERSCEDRGLML